MGARLGHAARAGLVAALACLAACAAPDLPRAVEGGGAVPAARVPAEAATLRIAGLSGLPGNAGDRIRDHFVDAAAARGLNVVLRQDVPVSYRLFGQLSAVGDVTGVTVAYVFDVLDANDVLVERVHGFETAPGTGGDPWSGVPDATLRLVAVRSVEAVNAWLRRPIATP